MSITNLTLACIQEAQLGIRRTNTIPVKFKQLVSDCLNPTNSMRSSKHHKLSEADAVDTPPARPINALDTASDTSPGEEEEVQSRQMDGPPSSKRIRVASSVSLSLSNMSAEAVPVCHTKGYTQALTACMATEEYKV